MNSIDLNCDMGESFGPWTMGNDAGILPFVSSANIACGFHAGDPVTIANTVKLALQNGVAIGAHPSYPDLQGFGRREMNLDAADIYDSVIYQIAAVKGICETSGGSLHHVKPHGALYNRAARDPDAARAIAIAVKDIGGDLILYGLSGSHLISEAELVGVRTASEVFADRTYGDDGFLTPRSESNALVEDTAAAASQVLSMIENGTVDSINGTGVPIKAETVCIHGDGPHALEFVQTIRSKLDDAGIRVEAIN